MIIFIKDKIGEILLSLNVKATDLIRSIKVQIEEELGVCRDEYRLIWAGKVLDDDDKRVDECNIALHSSLHMIAREQQSANRSREVIINTNWELV